ncbi:MAG: ATP-binding protein [Chloroflexi bacterium]|nr:ATP-binding protein [Chloroflexota bacterium]MCI0575177.1 ATP-binding protein [Chloroflexota bacterium]MCI0647141.1 ATP-binding protein [Chloroflexota bacterium]MCI0729983.1 ATP-binding protein [Chloroflexota bacterium]
MKNIYAYLRGHHSQMLQVALKRLIGVFDASPQPSLTERMQEMEDIARQLAAATEEADQALVQLQSLYEVAQELTTSLDLPHILQATATALGRFTGADSSAIWLISDNVLQMKAAYGLPPATINRLNRSANGQSHGPWLAQDSCLREATRRKEPVTVQAAATPRPGDHWLLESLSSTCLAAIPLVVQDVVIGLATLHSSTDHILAKLDLARTIAQQAAVVIQNGQLYEEVRQLNQSLENRIAARTHELVEEKKRLAGILRAQEVEASQKEAILASIADGVIACDCNGTILLLNPAAEEILGERGEFIAGRHQIFDLFEPGRREKVWQMFRALRKAGTNEGIAPVEMQEVIFEIDHRVISARLTLALGPAQEAIGLVTVLRDITREVEADRAKTDFISTVSHELRTPMTSIKGYTELMAREVAGPLTDQQRDWLVAVTRSAERLTMLINDLLDVAQIEAGKVRLEMQPVDLCQLAEQVLEVLLPAAQKKEIDLILQASPDLPPIQGDWGRITQVLTNLVGNAVTYTECGSVAVSIRPLNGHVQVSVQDTGIGIAPDELGHIFERFYRSSHPVVQNSRGTGLGLPIVKKFIEMHGGRIWVESEPGRGSTFTFILPPKQP